MSDAELQAEPARSRLRLKVPREHGSFYCVPPLESASGLARENHDLLESLNVDVQGRPLSTLRSAAREQLLRVAHEYTGNWIDLQEELSGEQLIYVTGHQPALFHPGVWVKNFAVGGLARRDHALGINLVIDNDTFSASSVKVPRGTRDRPALGLVEYDQGQGTRVWEGAQIQDGRIFESFAERVSQAMAPWNITPLIERLWPKVVDHSKGTADLAGCLTAGRNLLEREWGVANLELPISGMCRQESFLWFFSHIVAQLTRFRSTYNAALAEYRRANKIRSSTHPVPELRRNGEWQEAPFWVWRDGESERRRVYAQQLSGEIQLQDGEEIFAKLPLTSESSACCALEELRQLSEQGIHLRTRALTTTLFSRLCLADLFVHGIGGAKYDEMTDRILERFYGVTPPSYLAASATFLLPLDPFPADTADVTKLTTLIRNLAYNPQQSLSLSQRGDFKPLLDEQQNLIEDARRERKESRSRSGRRSRRPLRVDRDRRIREITRILAQSVAAQSGPVEDDRRQVESQIAANKVLANREYSFALYPEQELRQFMSDCVSTTEEDH